MLIQICKISKVFSINFILIRCGSVPYNYKTENVFAVCHMIRHTAKLADAAAGDARRQAAASTPRFQAAASTPRQAAGHVRHPRRRSHTAAPRPLLCRVTDRGAHGKGSSFAVGQIGAHGKAPAPYPL